MIVRLKETIDCVEVFRDTGFQFYDSPIKSHYGFR